MKKGTYKHSEERRDKIRKSKVNADRCLNCGCFWNNKIKHNCEETRNKINEKIKKPKNPNSRIN